MFVRYSLIGKAGLEQTLPIKLDKSDMKETEAMDELVKLVSKKTGISEAQAKQAVETVIGYLKGKLPAPIASQIDGILGGGTSPVADMAKGLGGLLKKK